MTRNVRKDVIELTHVTIEQCYEAAAGRQRSSGAKAWEYRRRLNEPRELGLGRADEKLGDSHRRFENGWPSVAFPCREVSEIRGRNIRQTRSTAASLAAYRGKRLRLVKHEPGSNVDCTTSPASPDNDEGVEPRTRFALTERHPVTRCLISMLPRAVHTT
jgi:hypothetical protein